MIRISAPGGSVLRVLIAHPGGHGMNESTTVFVYNKCTQLIAG